MAPVAELAAAAALLTRLPVRASGKRTGSIAFGAVGGLAGLVSAAPILLLGDRAALLAAVLALAGLALVSGALHLDGLSDTFDALAAPDREAAERARVDPAAGPAGVTALVLVVALDVSVIATLVDVLGSLGAGASVVAAASVSRAAAAGAALAARGRVRAGLGRWFVDGTSPAAAAVALLTALAIAAGSSAVGGTVAPFVGSAVALVAAPAVAVALVRARDGLDGDGLGAIVELTFAACLLGVLATALVAG